MRGAQRPLAVDLYCGLGGWTEGLMSEGFDVVGFDIEQHVYGAHRYPATLVLQDVRTIHGSQFRNASLIVASSPCQEFSYRAMPWKRAKALGPPVLGMELFAQAARIQREACEAAGRYIPMVQENVRGAQRWVGRAHWNFGSFYLWGDIPAVMPFAYARKNTGGSWFNIGSPGQKITNNNPARGQGGNKAASARIAKAADALWITSWPFAEYVRHAWAGAWVCSCFRNESPLLSSDLITEAVAATRYLWGDPPSLGIVTFVDADKTRRKRDPGRCYRRAGWKHVGFTQGGLWALQLLPADCPAAIAPLGELPMVAA